MTVVSGADMSAVGGVNGRALVSSAGKVALAGRVRGDLSRAGSSRPSIPMPPTVLLLLRGLLTPPTGSPGFRSGLVRGLLLGLNASLNFLTGDLLRILLMLCLLLSTRRVSALSTNGGKGRSGVDSELVGADLGDGEASGCGGSTSEGTL